MGGLDWGVVHSPPLHLLGFGVSTCPHITNVLLSWTEPPPYPHGRQRACPVLTCQHPVGSPVITGTREPESHLLKKSANTKADPNKPRLGVSTIQVTITCPKLVNRFLSFKAILKEAMHFFKKGVYGPPTIQSQEGCLVKHADSEDLTLGGVNTM